MSNCLVCDEEMKRRHAYAWQCPKCGFWHSDLPDGVGRGVDGIEELRRGNFHKICDRFERITKMKDRTFLEIGCAEGWFLDEVKIRGGVALGIEPSDVSNIPIKAGHEVRVGFFPDVLTHSQKFDCIVFNDVFEHLPDPKSVLHACETHLNDNGYLLINLPSSAGFFFRVAFVLARLGAGSFFDRLWQKGFASPHLWYFDPATLDQLVTQSGKLTKVDGFELDVIEKEGLRQRISASHGGAIGGIITAAIVVMQPIIGLFPSDIIVHIYRKSQAAI